VKTELIAHKEKQSVADMDISREKSSRGKEVKIIKQNICWKFAFLKTFPNEL
jgi:hypothetical protein